MADHNISKRVGDRSWHEAVNHQKSRISICNLLGFISGAYRLRSQHYGSLVDVRLEFQRPDCLEEETLHARAPIVTKMDGPKPFLKCVTMSWSSPKVLQTYNGPINTMLFGSCFNYFWRKIGRSLTTLKSVMFMSKSEIGPLTGYPQAAAAAPSRRCGRSMPWSLDHLPVKSSSVALVEAAE
jgi:hypothetical protein